MKAFWFGLCAAVSTGFANAAIINLDSTDSSNGVALMLDAGSYDVSFVEDEYTAWRAWNRTTGCDASGANCSRGWMTSAKIESSELGQYWFGYTGRFENAELALSHAMTTTFTLSARQSVLFFIGDSYWRDNIGGVSLKVASSAVPIPAAGLLFGAALVVGLKRRRAAQA